MLAILAQTLTAAPSAGPIRDQLGELGAVLVAALVTAAIGWVKAWLAAQRETARANDASRAKETLIVGVEAAGVAMADHLAALLPAKIRAAMSREETAALARALAKATKGDIKAVAVEAGTERLIAPSVLAITEAGAVSTPELVDAARRVTAERRAVSPSGSIPPPPRLGALLALLLPLALLTGCIAPAARDLAVKHEALLIAFDGASVPHPSYTVDDAEPGADGRKLTAAEKLAAWKAARAEVLRSAGELRRVIGGEE